MTVLWMESVPGPVTPALIDQLGTALALEIYSVNDPDESTIGDRLVSRNGRQSAYLRLRRDFDHGGLRLELVDYANSFSDQEEWLELHEMVVRVLRQTVTGSTLSLSGFDTATTATALAHDLRRHMPWAYAFREPSVAKVLLQSLGVELAEELGRIDELLAQRNTERPAASHARSAPSDRFVSRLETVRPTVALATVTTAALTLAAVDTLGNALSLPASPSLAIAVGLTALSALASVLLGEMQLAGTLQRMQLVLAMIVAVVCGGASGAIVALDHSGDVSSSQYVYPSLLVGLSSLCYWLISRFRFTVFARRSEPTHHDQEQVAALLVRRRTTLRRYVAKGGSILEYIQEMEGELRFASTRGGLADIPDWLAWANEELRRADEATSR